MTAKKMKKVRNLKNGKEPPNNLLGVSPTIWGILGTKKILPRVEYATFENARKIAWQMQNRGAPILQHVRYWVFFLLLCSDSKAGMSNANC